MSPFEKTPTADLVFALGLGQGDELFLMLVAHELGRRAGGGDSIAIACVAATGGVGVGMKTYKTMTTRELIDVKRAMERWRDESSPFASPLQYSKVCRELRRRGEGVD